MGPSETMTDKIETLGRQSLETLLGILRSPADGPGKDRAARLILQMAAEARAYEDSLPKEATGR